MKKNLIKGTLLGLVGLVFICTNSAMAEGGCTIEIDGSTQYLELWDYVDLYSKESGESGPLCEDYREWIECSYEGENLGSWYSSCEFRPNSPIVLKNGDLKVCGTEYVSNDNGATGCITIMDRNLGATSNDITSSDSYGNYYQRGNNYGFSSNPNATITTSNQQIDCSTYNPLNPFVGSTFIITLNRSFFDYCTTENDNLWGGGDDESMWESTNSYPVENERDRRGPCPKNYHVPSIGEWRALMDMWAGGSVNGNYQGTKVGTFQSDFKIPFAGSRGGGDGSVYGGGAYLWSSSPHVGYADARPLIINEGLVAADDYEWSRINGYPVRCFKDSTPVLVSIINNSTTTTIGGNTVTGLSTNMTVTENTISTVEGKEVLGEVNVDFGSNQTAIFSHPVEVNIPVSDLEQVYVKVKHGGDSEYGFAGLTTNRNTTCSNGEPISNQYNGETINVVDGYATIYSCAASSFIALGVDEGGEGVEGPSTAQINLSVLKGTLTIGTTTGNLNLGEVNVSNNAQELSGSFGANSFWVEDMKGVETGYYTTISVTDLNGTVAGHSISASNVSLKTAGSIPNDISGAAVDDAKVIFGEGITNWHSGSGQVNYFQRLNTSTAEAGRVGKWGDNLQVKVNVPAHTPYDTYRGTITYTLYDLDS